MLVRGATRARERAGSDSGISPALEFPSPVGSFVGREAELARISGHLDEDVLFFIYGVGGIGKSELVYQLAERLQQHARWRDATAVRVQVARGETALATVGRLLAEFAPATDQRGRAHPAEQALSHQLTQLSRLLNARSYLLFIDDAHHLPGDELAEVVRYLSRHVQRSRLIVASRREIRLPADAPPPVVTAVGPLEPGAAEAMLAAVAERLQVPIPDAQEMLRAAHGSPLLIRRMVDRQDAHDDVLEETLAELSAGAQRLLLLVAVAPYRPNLVALGALWSDARAFAHCAGELQDRFLVLVERGRCRVESLIRDRVLQRVSAGQRASAHREAAVWCSGQLTEGDASSLRYAVEAVEHFVAAGEPHQAWELVARWHSALAARGLDYLLVTPLEQVAEALPEQREAAGLMLARCLVRSSEFVRAESLLAELDGQLAPEQQARYCAVAAEVAIRRGQLEHAHELLAQADKVAVHEVERYHLCLQRAMVTMLSGDGAGAREQLDRAFGQLREPSLRHQGRCGWARAVSWLFDEQFERAAVEAGRVRAVLSDSGLDDLVHRLAMIEALAWIEAGEMTQARAASRLIADVGLREPVCLLYRAIVDSANGEVVDASKALLEARDRLLVRGDLLHAYLAGYHAAIALAEAGALAQARAEAEQAAVLVSRGNYRALEARTTVLRAQLAVGAAHSVIAHGLAEQTLASAQLGPWAGVMAHRVHARAYAMEGDIALALDQIVLARAQAESSQSLTIRVAVDLDQAVIDLVGGNLQRAVECAECAAEHFCSRARDYDSVWAQIVLAATYLARGRRTDLLLAERAIAQARELADRGGLRPLQTACAVLSASLARHGRPERAAEGLLAKAMRDLEPERGAIYTHTLIAAIEGGAALGAVPGVVALLAHLGFSDAVDCYLVDQHGRRAATDKDVEREKALRELFVDEVRSVITARSGRVEIVGRPMQCALLSVLIQARGEPVSPETLYKEVWDSSEYHPLQHRNALYVAINRLRNSLREALDGRDVVVRASNGWSLADDVDACVAVAARM